MLEFEKYLTEANSYAKAAFGAFEKNRLGSQVVYNLVGLAIENYLTALCMNYNIMPEHSSIASMLSLLKKQIEVPQHFQTEARFMNKFMNFCALDIFEPKDPSRANLARMLSFTEEVKVLCEDYICTTESA